jgi:hypothetical protein
VYRRKENHGTGVIRISRIGLRQISDLAESLDIGELSRVARRAKAGAQ